MLCLFVRITVACGEEIDPRSLPLCTAPPSWACNARRSMRAILHHRYSKGSQASAPSSGAVFVRLGQSDESHIVNGVADIGEVTIGFEAPQDAQYDLLARGAGTTSI
jgi:hypothetical protein